MEPGQLLLARMPFVELAHKGLSAALLVPVHRDNTVVGHCTSLVHLDAVFVYDHIPALVEAMALVVGHQLSPAYLPRRSMAVVVTPC